MTEMDAKNINELVRPRWSHLEYRWRLDNFWELRALACVEALEDENGGLIWSQRFGDKERGFWQLKLYPYGDLSPAGRGHVSLFLSLDLKSLEFPKAYAIFGCYLLDEEGQKVANSGRSFTRQKFAEGSSSWGWSQFIKVEGQLLNRLLAGPNDSLIIKCEIEVFVGVMAAPGRNLPAPKTWEEELREYVTNPSHHDVALYCDGRLIKANKNVLCARSKYFEAHFETLTTGSTKRAEDPFQMSIANSTRDSTVTNSNSIPYTSFGGLDGAMSSSAPPPTSLAPVKETKNVDTPSQGCRYSLEMTTVTPDALENIVQFLHTDDCRWFVEETHLTNLLEMFLGAKDLEIESLYRVLMRKLSGMCVTKPTAIAVLEVAKKVGAAELQEHCRSFLLMCARELTDEELLKALVPKR
eukprot:Protomagalhaensia_wolfi_Nauph_80__724@NODE_1412_length_1542_cov_113_735862_g1092_i0_p1_GENE_NODE_1412_length_1542_cov_113_735862_g1092_i0NODE_1412_length_1542_cov_113_735862_g1092_i0_p1_ORF_typecomplete_len411_score71_85BTB/PF00651_31/1_1e12MATH/PF00917_26/4_8e12MATH/PF00917_26/7_8e03BACK/PF07707_15/42BACK/PF07707_15/5_4_NODE_1412_length_1542_cov_113_735862_g1092_i02011433